MSDEKTAADIVEEAAAGRLTSEMSDQEIADALDAAREARKAQIEADNAANPAPRAVSLQDLYHQMTALVQSVARTQGRDQRLTEAGAIKILELSLGWALQTRQQPANPILNDLPTGEIGGEGEEGTTPDEAIGFEDDTEQEPAA